MKVYRVIDVMNGRLGALLAGVSGGCAALLVDVLEIGQTTLREALAVGCVAGVLFITFCVLAAAIAIRREGREGT